MFLKKLDKLVMHHSFMWCNLKLSQEDDGVSIWSDDSISLTEAQRTLSILQGYITLYLTSAQESSPVLSEDNLPSAPREDARFAVWFDRLSHTANQDAYIRLCYNAFGALPDGFNRVNDVINQRLGAPLAEKFLSHLEILRQDEGDLAEQTVQTHWDKPWQKNELAQIKAHLFCAWKDAYS